MASLPLPAELQAALPPTHLAAGAESREQCRQEWLDLHLDFEVLHSAEDTKVPALSDPRLEPPLERILVSMGAEEDEWREGAANLERKWSDEANALIARWRAEDAARLAEQREHAIDEVQTNESAMIGLQPASVYGWSVLLDVTNLRPLGTRGLASLCISELLDVPASSRGGGGGGSGGSGGSGGGSGDSGSSGSGGGSGTANPGACGRPMPGARWLSTISQVQLRGLLSAIRRAGGGALDEEPLMSGICTALSRAALRPRQGADTGGDAPPAAPARPSVDVEAYDSIAMVNRYGQRAAEVATAAATAIRYSASLTSSPTGTPEGGSGYPSSPPSDLQHPTRGASQRTLQFPHSDADGRGGDDLAARLTVVGGAEGAEGAEGALAPSAAAAGAAAAAAAAAEAAAATDAALSADSERLTPLALLAFLLILVDATSPTARLEVLLEALLPNAKPGAPLTVAEQRLAYAEMAEACRIAVCAAAELPVVLPSVFPIPPPEVSREARAAAGATEHVPATLRSALDLRPTTWAICPPDARAFAAWCATVAAPTTIGAALAGVKDHHMYLHQTMKGARGVL